MRHHPRTLIRRQTEAGPTRSLSSHSSPRLAALGSAWVWASTALLLPAAGQQPEDAVASPTRESASRLHRLDGSILTAVVTAIEPEGAVIVRGGTAPIPLDDVRRIEREAAATPSPLPPATVQLTLAAGGSTHGESVGIRDDQLLMQGGPAGSLTLGIDAVRVLRVRTPEPDWESHLQRAAETPRREVDRIFFVRNEALDMVRGLVVGLDAETLYWEREGKIREMPREDLYGVVFAEVRQPGDRSPPHGLFTLDGSTWWGQLEGLQNGLVTLRVGPQDRLQIPWQQVYELRVRSPRLQFLSDLEPTRAYHEPIVTAPRNWRRDASVEGRPLTLSGTQFEKGIGMASYAELVYDLSDSSVPYVWLAARIGIDDETRGRGDCVYVVLGDGRELLRRRVRPAPPASWNAARSAGTEDPSEDSSAALGPQSIRVDIRGINRLTLRVEPGEDLDLADHANWCDLRLIRAAEASQP